MGLCYLVALLLVVVMHGKDWQDPPDDTSEL